METNPGPRRPVPAVCRLLCSNVLGLAGNLSDPTLASSRYDILLCCETLLSDMRHVSELLVPGFGRPVLLCRSRMPWARRMAAYIRDAHGAFRQPKFEWLLRNADFYGLWCKTELICIQSLLQT